MNETKLFDCMLRTDVRPEIGDTERLALVRMAESVGLKAAITPGNICKDFVFMKVIYDIDQPVEFWTSDGIEPAGHRWRVGTPTKRIMGVTAHVSWMHPLDEKVYRKCYSVNFKLYGYHWKYGRKHHIVAELPEGLHNVYEYGEDITDFEDDIVDVFRHIKKAIDGGTPIMKK